VEGGATISESRVHEGEERSSGRVDEVERQTDGRTVVHPTRADGQLPAEGGGGGGVRECVRRGMKSEGVGVV
jgi:hypothetical protein